VCPLLSAALAPSKGESIASAGATDGGDRPQVSRRARQTIHASRALCLFIFPLHQGSAEEARPPLRGLSHGNDGGCDSQDDSRGDERSGTTEKSGGAGKDAIILSDTTQTVRLKL